MAPAYPPKQPSRSTAFGQHPTAPNHGGPLSNMGYGHQYSAQQPASSGMKGQSYARRATSSKGADSTSNERPQPFSRQYDPSQGARSSSNFGKGPEPRHHGSYKAGLGVKDHTTHSTKAFNPPPKMESIQNVVQNAQKIVDNIGKQPHRSSSKELQRSHGRQEYDFRQPAYTRSNYANGQALTSHKGYQSDNLVE